MQSSHLEKDLVGVQVKAGEDLLHNQVVTGVEVLVIKEDSRDILEEELNLLLLVEVVAQGYRDPHVHIVRIGMRLSVGI